MFAAGAAGRRAAAGVCEKKERRRIPQRKSADGLLAREGEGGCRPCVFDASLDTELHPVLPLAERINRIHSVLVRSSIDRRVVWVCGEEG